jgi:tetratricopeptide (TPR) repeat protein
MREAINRAETAEDSNTISLAVGNLAPLLMTSEPAAAAEASRSSIAHARRIGDRYLLSDGVCNLMQALLLTGDWDEIENVYRSTTGEEEVNEDPIIAFSVVLLRAFRNDRSGLKAVLPLMAQWHDTEDVQDRAEAATALAAAAASSGDRSEALDRARDALAHADELGFTHDGIRWAWAIAADAALTLHDLDEVVRLLGWLDEHPRGQIPPVLRGEQLRIRARLLAIDNDPKAGKAFDGAMKALGDLGSPYHMAVGLLDHAEYLAATGDALTARRLTDEAGDIAERLAAKPLIDRVRSLQAQKMATGTPIQ